jgi:hypothetical protein
MGSAHQAIKPNLALNSTYNVLSGVKVSYVILYTYVN